VSRTVTVEPAPVAEVQRMQLTAEEAFVYTRADRPMPLGTLLASCGLPEAQARGLVESLVRKGALRAPGLAAAAGPAAAPTGAARAGVAPVVPVPAAVRAEPRWTGYRFTPAELDEKGVELEIDLRKEILFLFYNRERLSHYRFLGISAAAGDAEVRRALDDGARRLHPDAYRGRSLGGFLARLEALAPRLDQARATLLDAKAREAYDRQAGTVFTSEERQALALREVERLEEEERDQKRRGSQLLQSQFANLPRARALVADARRALAGGNPIEAIRLAQQAQGVDPRLAEAEEVRRKACVVQAAQMLKTARAERGGVPGLALLQRVLELDPDNGAAHEDCARICLEQNDLRAAQMHAQRAIDLGRPQAIARELLGETLLKLGLRKNAARELERAIAAGAGEKAKALLKSC